MLKILVNQLNRYIICAWVLVPEGRGTRLHTFDDN